MRRLRFVAALLLAACTACTSRPQLPARVVPDPVTTRQAPVATAGTAFPRLDQLTLREKAAQMVWPTILGDFVPESDPRSATVAQWVREEGVGGLTISVGSPTEIAARLNALQRMARVPLLVGADLEFGAGYRARGGYFLPNAIDLGGAVLFPQQMALGAARDTALAYEQGRVTALEGRALGIHVAYAPVLDVNNNPDNPVINTRSYGEDPRLAARLGAAFVRGVQEHGMIATGKHFPGHGDTETNSHLALPVVGVSRARLDSVELVPFRAAIAAGVGAIMSFHGAMPALDSVPGTLSPRVLGGLLRGEMGFRGLVISDAMDMRGVLDTYGATEAAKRAVAAGADILIQPLDVRETIDAIVAGVRDGRYTEARLDSSVARILDAKRGVGLDRVREVALDSVRAVVGDTAHAAAAARAAERGLTLVKDSLGQVPLPRTRPGAAGGTATTGSARQSRVLSISVARRTDLGAGATFDAELRRRLTVRSAPVTADDLGLHLPRLTAAADSFDVVIVSSYMGHAWDASTVGAPRGLEALVRQLAARRRAPVLVAMGNPYLLRQVPQVAAYLVAWSGAPAAQQAAARALLGERGITGALPIAIPGVAAIGTGLRRNVLP